MHTVLSKSLGADSEFVLTARWQQWGYRSCPQKWDFWITWQKLDKYAFAINAHFAAKSYNFWIHKVKFNKVEGIIVFPERSDKNFMKTGWISEVQRYSESSWNTFKVLQVLLLSLLATACYIESGWNPASNHIIKASSKAWAQKDYQKYNIWI